VQVVDIASGALAVRCIHIHHGQSVEVMGRASQLDSRRVCSLQDMSTIKVVTGMLYCRGRSIS
jgi:hypothetical protein